MTPWPSAADQQGINEWPFSPREFQGNQHLIMSNSFQWWDPTRYSDRRPFLLARAQIKSAVRAWFHEEGFIEVDPSCLQISPGNEAHLHALTTEVVASDLSRLKRYLHTSPEFSMKKLLAAGEKRIFYLGPCFRNREQGAIHSTEFTMLEWYRVGAPFEAVMKDAHDLLRLACRRTGQSLISWKGKITDPHSPFESLSVCEAFSRYAGIDLQSSLPEGTGEPDRSVLGLQAERAGMTVRTDDTWSDLFSRILTGFIEPRLGVGQPTLLHRYPTWESALARVCPEDARFAERFELYCCGMELANGFGEMRDPEHLRINLERQMLIKQERYGEIYPLDEDFLEAMKQMPDASGCALGFDRLIMLATGATHINHVLWTPSG